MSSSSISATTYSASIALSSFSTKAQFLLLSSILKTFVAFPLFSVFSTISYDPYVISEFSTMLSLAMSTFSPSVLLCNGTVTVCIAFSV